MATIPINDVTPKNSYVATADQTIFPYTYFLNQADDLEVYVNGVEIVSGFTISNLQNPSGGNVTFNTGLEAGDVVVLVRCSVIERLADFEESGAFFADAVNLEYTYGVVVDQDLKRKIGDKIGLADFETADVKTDLPAVTGNNGSLIQLQLDSDTGQYCFNFASPSDIFTASLPLGTAGTILGYETDGSVGEYTAGTNITIDDSTNTISATIPAFNTEVTVQEEGVVVGTTFDTFNFVGAEVTATDGGSNVATITVTATGGGTPDDNTVGLAQLAPGTPDTVQAFDGTGEPEYLPKSDLGSKVLLGEIDVTNVTSVDIGSGLDIDATIDSTYDTYEITFFELVPQNDLADMEFRISSDTGVNFDDTSGDYGWSYIRNGSGSNPAVGANGEIDDACRILDNAGNDVGESCSGKITLFNPSNTTVEKMFRHETIYSRDAADETYQTSGGSMRRNVTTAYDALRLFFSNGNIISGTVKVYGIK